MCAFKWQISLECVENKYNKQHQQQLSLICQESYTEYNVCICITCILLMNLYIFHLISKIRSAQFILYIEFE